jgi:protease-4
MEEIKMKKTMLILIVMLVVVSAFAQDFAGSISNSDVTHSAMINPAALGRQNNTGFTFMKELNKDFEDSDHYFLEFNSEGLNYIYENNDGRETHVLASGDHLFGNFYLGTQWKWNYSDFKNGDYKIGALYHPSKFTSFAFTDDNAFSGNDIFTYSVGIRPFANQSKWGNRISFTADFPHYKDENDEYKIYSPQLGLQTELFDGINLNAMYDLESETTGIQFGFRFSSSEIGIINNSRKDSDLNNSYSYIHLSNKTFRTLPFFSPRQKFYHMNLGSEIIDSQKGMKIGPFKLLFNDGRTLDEVLAEIEKVKNTDTIQGIYITSGNTRTSFANFSELRDAFLDLKKAGKKIVFYFDSIGNVNYAFAASIADKIYLNPMGSVDLHGLSINQPYFKGLLDTLGIKVENFRSHKYKTAGNSFSETEMTDGERESMEYLLEGLYQEMITMIEQGRKDKLAMSAEDLIDNGPYFIAKSALENGLVDELIYQDEIRTYLKKEFQSKHIIKELPQEQITYDWAANDPETKVAIIYAVGGIHMGKGKQGQSIGSKTTSELIRKARKNTNVKGIIIRVNSGGGSALASDIIAREVKLCKEAGKPVVVSMGGAAASGGYYISSFADKIVAQPSTITGSIGVIGMVPNFSGLYEKIHVNWSNVKKGKYADLGNTSRPMTSDEKEKIHNSIEHTYWTFVDIVAEGRSMSRENVHNIAQGRVWTGTQAKERGLVDEIGGLDVAKKEMQKLLKTNKKIKLVNMNKSVQDGLEINIDGSPFSFGFSSKFFFNKDMETMKKAYETIQNAEQERILLVPDFTLPTTME